MNRLAMMLILVIAAVSESSCASNAFNRSSSELTTTSPNNTFVVHMQEREGTSGLLIRLDVKKQDQPLIENGIFDSGESSPFLYPERKYSWAEDNVLRFGQISCCVHDQISITNQTQKVIRYLRLDAGNVYLLLELQPGQKTQLQDNAQTDQRADISWIGGFGRFADGKEFSNWGMNFQIRGKYKAPAHYCIQIQEDRVLVQSREFEGFQSGESGKTVARPEAKSPACE